MAASLRALLRAAGTVMVLAVVFAFAILPRAAQAQSPELWQLLNEINGQLKVLSPAITSNPVCLPAMVDMAKQGVQSGLASTALGKVVVEPLEQGAKLALGLAGVPGLAISTYSLMRCAMGASSPADFGRCLRDEAIGFAAGTGMEKAGLEGLEGALAGIAWDKAYGTAKDAWDAYGVTSEDVEWEAGGDCKIKVAVNWNKRRRPGAEGGTIFISVRAEGCKCSTGSSLKQGSLRVNVPVRYSRAGSAQPGFSAGFLQDLRVEATCCSNPGTDSNVFLLNSAGRLTGVVRPDAPSAAPQPPVTQPRPTGQPPVTTPPPRPPSPPPAPVAKPKPKPQPTWPPSDADLPKVCPECNRYLEAINKLRAQIAQLETQRADLDRQLSDARKSAGDAEADIRRSRAELDDQKGTGGSAYDPASGNTTEAMTQADGRVRIRVTDAKGNVLDERFRERKDLDAARKRLAEAEKQLEQARANEARAQQAIANNQQERARAAAAIRTQEALYEECIEKCRRKVLFGEPAMGVAITPPVEFLGGVGGGIGGAFLGAPTIGGVGAAGGASVTSPPGVSPPAGSLVVPGGGVSVPPSESILSLLPGFRAPVACPACAGLVDEYRKAQANLENLEKEVAYYRRRVEEAEREDLRLTDLVAQYEAVSKAAEEKRALAEDALRAGAVKILGVDFTDSELYGALRAAVNEGASANANLNVVRGQRFEMLNQLVAFRLALYGFEKQIEESRVQLGTIQIRLEDCVEEKCKPVTSPPGVSPPAGSLVVPGGGALPPSGTPAPAGGSILSTLTSFRCPECQNIDNRYSLLMERWRTVAQRKNEVLSKLYDLQDSIVAARDAGLPIAPGIEFTWRALSAQLPALTDAEFALSRERFEAELQLSKCLAKCKAFAACTIDVERVVNIAGNNPFDTLDPLRDGRSSTTTVTGSPISPISPVSPAPPPAGACSTTISPKTFLSCAPNGCSVSTPITLSVSSGTVTLNPLNAGVPANGPVAFCNGTSTSNNLNILGLPGHQCSITGVGASLLIQCQNNFGAGPGFCSSLCN